MMKTKVQRLPHTLWGTPAAHSGLYYLSSLPSINSQFGANIKNRKLSTADASRDRQPRLIDIRSQTTHIYIKNSSSASSFIKNSQDQQKHQSSFQNDFLHRRRTCETPKGRHRSQWDFRNQAIPGAEGIRIERWRGHFPELVLEFGPCYERVVEWYDNILLIPSSQPIYELLAEHDHRISYSISLNLTKHTKMSDPTSHPSKSAKSCAANPSASSKRQKTPTTPSAPTP